MKSDKNFRLVSGGQIDRNREIKFTFNNKTYTGVAGDTLASALLANGVELVGRSFKLHRPRGIMAAGMEESNAFVQVGEGARHTTNVNATQVEIYDGLKAHSVHCWPSVEHDFGAITGAFARLLPSGFYYKTFMWPANFWRIYEHVIRGAAGLGKAPEVDDADTYSYRYEHYDLVIVGSGPAGLAAAKQAAASSVSVLLVEQDFSFGGNLLSEEARIDSKPAVDWVKKTLDELSGYSNVTLLSRATLTGYYDGNHLTVLERVTDHLPEIVRMQGIPRERLWKIRAKQVVLATGSIERPLVFANNDRPGVMLASGALTYLQRFGVKSGRKAVVFTNNDTAYSVAVQMQRSGVEVAAIVDLRKEPPQSVRQLANENRIKLIAGHVVHNVLGKKRVKGVEVSALIGDRLGSENAVIDCDLVLQSGGWTPTVHLFSQAGGKLLFDERQVCLRPDEASVPKDLYVAGACNGNFSLSDALREGAEVAAQAVRSLGHQVSGSLVSKASNSPVCLPEALWRVPSRKEGIKRFVDYHNDVGSSDVELANREGYRSVEHLKRYTTTGMGPDQGRTSNINALAILAEEQNTTIPAVGTTRFRPPYTPISFGAVAGRRVGEFFQVKRKTSLYATHEQAGAVFEPAGLWMRPDYYPRSSESREQAVLRECRAVRNAVGIFDASSLGKLDIQGPDALKLLNMVYANGWDTLKPGACRYGLMLKEDGCIFDDGVTACLAENHYHMTTTTGNAEKVYNWIEEWLQCEWLDWNVYVTPVTTQWAAVSIAGPKARELLKLVGTDIDLSTEAFPHMQFREGNVAGIPARVFRISFTGEHSYEINVPSSYAPALWQALMQAGQGFGITPFGLEAIHRLRAEKGYIAVGLETDGTTTPFDLGMSWAVGKKKTDYLGMRSQSLTHLARAGRRQLVGLLTDDLNFVLPEGAQIRLEANGEARSQGNVSSSYMSATLDRSIALAMLENGAERHGETVAIHIDGRKVTAKVTKPLFYDEEGRLLNA
ncbi:TPA: sarcosine oxidase subunit alpha family protein [Pseudomonas aeruginosa]|uniref:sarcosine oxidase subunit alpha family protein n=1 Tax=Pseudomonas TaxID=286 RepID=UPI00093BD784|nr:MULTISPECIES: sarcosine oxidase subunit alpha family protein [Pseudomonas]EKX2957012.1 sarcosine oxidase subunit alpha family protein [Pseudomonas aeruginosa]MBG4113926.1 sarcosine oxidase subunit alpha family protein [Pseudomonas aeruginosa]MBI6936944.1 sarcosine oxidase subunit alpha family protein [Pseudomonas aeruginosa]MBI8014269.1 sarcosine oxidase subunit alpha family protein [Pseudomonas aeruginosa]MBV6241915.1 sarcosine oxidase subunit alpha family protein [Pseudomonas aeruginosa]